MAISNAYSQSRVARGVAIQTIFKDLRQGQLAKLPQRIALIGQGSTAASFSTDKAIVLTAGAAGETYGFGSPIHLAMQQLLPVNGDGVGSIPITVYPLEDDVSGVAAAGVIEHAGAATKAASYRVSVNNIISEPFVVSVGDTESAIVTAMAAAINAVLEMPVVATADTTPASEKVDLVAKWKGVTGNDIVFEVIGDTDAGNTWALTQPTGGLVDPDIQDALDQFGDVHETLVVNCLTYSDTLMLNKVSDFGEGRWHPEVRKPFVSLVGTTVTDVTTVAAITDARKTDRVNGLAVLPASKELPFVVAARVISRIAVRADNDPAYDYGSMPLTGLIPGEDGDQWSSTERDFAIKAGTSSVIVRDGVANIADTVTFYHPDSEVVPAYRYVVDIMKVMTISYNLGLIFDSPRWDGKPLIPDNQPTTNPNAKKPRMAVADIALLIDSLALNAIISDAGFAKDNTVAGISESNPKRLDVATTMKISGNSNVISVDFNFGFFFGTAAVVG